MGWLNSTFGWSGGKTTQSPSVQSAASTAAFNNDTSYQQLKTLYITNPIAKAIVDKIIEMALARKRNIKIGDANDTIIKRFEKTYEEKGLADVLAHHMNLTAIYGASYILVVADGLDPKKPITIKEIQQHDWKMNCADPLAAQMQQITQDPTNPDFQRPTSVSAWGQTFAKSKAHVSFYNNPIYIHYNGSTFNFGGLSIYQPIQAELVGLEAGTTGATRILSTQAMFVYQKEKTELNDANQITQDANSISAVEISQARTGQVLVIGKDEELKLFNHNQDNAVKDAFDILMLKVSLGTNISKRLLDEEKLSSSMAEGGEDANMIDISLKAFIGRFKKAISFIDYYCMIAAWTPEFYESLKKDKGWKKDNLLKHGYEVFLHELIRQFTYDYTPREDNTPKEVSETRKNNTERALAVYGALTAAGADKEEALTWLDTELMETDSMEQSLGLVIAAGFTEEPKDDMPTDDDKEEKEGGVNGTDKGK